MRAVLKNPAELKRRAFSPATCRLRSRHAGGTYSLNFRNARIQSYTDGEGLYADPGYEGFVYFSMRTWYTFLHTHQDRACQMLLKYMAEQV